MKYLNRGCIAYTCLVLFCLFLFWRGGGRDDPTRKRISASIEDLESQRQALNGRVLKWRKIRLDNFLSALHHLPDSKIEKPVLASAVYLKGTENDGKVKKFILIDWIDELPQADAFVFYCDGEEVARVLYPEASPEHHALNAFEALAAVIYTASIAPPACTEESDREIYVSVHNENGSFSDPKPLLRVDRDPLLQGYVHVTGKGAPIKYVEERDVTVDKELSDEQSFVSDRPSASKMDNPVLLSASYFPVHLDDSFKRVTGQNDKVIGTVLVNWIDDDPQVEAFVFDCGGKEVARVPHPDKSPSGRNRYKMREDGSLSVIIMSPSCMESEKEVYVSVHNKNGLSSERKLVVRPEEDSLPGGASGDENRASDNGRE